MENHFEKLLFLLHARRANCELLRNMLSNDAISEIGLMFIFTITVNVSTWPEYKS